MLLESLVRALDHDEAIQSLPFPIHPLIQD